MQNTLVPSAINDEIDAIRKELFSCLDNDLPLDTVKLKRLETLAVERIKELVSTHQQRTEFMKAKTREMTEKISRLNFQGKPDIKEKILEEQARYDKAATHWAIGESCLWDESEASTILAGILITAAQ